ncbi:tRNA (adenosine(37)-N6)-dimethylallyltransferase MiaA [Bacillus sp. FJAT-27225]|uniref:tRNA (adenosine(37)-N6)-dimethylallyltransferase MiaA n=1 Tax=Bacillus sp. FJAT-27225 TaxID=1743144 RepID=UPI00080C2FED|nr:tRNA (adenosine(37)-N6)-dimethylallyltransferase MiaA [Bacillus sp. FJAT-27225]OCA89280.1 tRNA (adenosine(37)-N6)-dimethylallyltransferase MiaA [Bacillus sp. FJAT-27225]
MDSGRDILDSLQKLIVIIGPTAVGKTKLGVELAKRYNGEIISGDSMQVYKGMDIGTAKVTPEETEGIPHHLIDIKEPDEPFSVAEFQSIVRKKIGEISSRGKLPIIVGGTGLYIQAVLYDYHFSDSPANEEFRSALEQKAMTEGNEAVHNELANLDPEAASQLHPNNLRRVIRAIELIKESGMPLRDVQKQNEPDLLYQAAIIGLTMEREKLYERINKRVDLMMKAGLHDEVHSLVNKGFRNTQAMQAIGYKEFFPYFDGGGTLEESVELLKQNSRRYAKRQLTWFRNKMDVEWYDMTNEDTLSKKITEISGYIEGKLQVKSNT